MWEGFPLRIPAKFLNLLLTVPEEEEEEHMLSCVWLLATPGTSPPGSSVHGIFHARILEWVAIFYSRDWNHISCIFCLSRWILYHYCHQDYMPTIEATTMGKKTECTVWVELSFHKDGCQNEIWILLRKENKRLLIFGTEAKLSAISTDNKSSHWSSFQRNYLHTNLTEICRCYQRVSEWWS